MTPPPTRVCPFCGAAFTPRCRLPKRQYTCGHPDCQKLRAQEARLAREALRSEITPAAWAVELEKRREWKQAYNRAN